MAFRGSHKPGDFEITDQNKHDAIYLALGTPTKVITTPTVLTLGTPTEEEESNVFNQNLICRDFSGSTPFMALPVQKRRF